ncbi:MAG: response regulator [Pseudomonadota bacterium]|jgi:CheY-like chemotaxis protein|nr:response regulator [Sphingomonas sp.]MDQ3471884.1 response regulator [Pseudomonadota bacterium]
MPECSGRPLVLVVEDEPLVRFAAVDTLEDLGAWALEAQDAREALQLLGEHPQVKILFTDINMPGAMDGLQLARHVHEVRPDVAIVVTSGKQFVEEADLPGRGSFLPKPYRPEQLKQLVSSKLG